MIAGEIGELLEIVRMATYVRADDIRSWKRLAPWTNRVMVGDGAPIYLHSIGIFV